MPDSTALSPLGRATAALAGKTSSEAQTIRDIGAAAVKGMERSGYSPGDPTFVYALLFLHSLEWSVGQKPPQTSGPGRPAGKETVSHTDGLSSTRQFRHTCRKRYADKDWQADVEDLVRSEAAAGRVRYPPTFDRGFWEERSEGSDEWYTPGHVIEAAREMMGGIDFDPASSEKAQSVVRATKGYLFEGGATAEWPSGSRVWCNPPYSQKSEFCARVVEHDGPWVVLLPAAHLDAKAMQGILSWSAAFVLVAGRLTFWREGEEGKNVLGSIIACSRGILPGTFRDTLGATVEGVYVEVHRG